MSDNPVLIRPAVPADLESLVSIERSCSGLPWQRSSLMRDLTAHAAARYRVAEDVSGAVVGYIAGWVILDEAEIINLAVLPDWRCRGIGLQLLLGLITDLQAEGVGRFFLDVREKNEAAIALYRRAGFSPVGRRDDYYADTGESAIIMSHLIGESDE